MEIQNQVAPPPTKGEARIRTSFNVAPVGAVRTNVDVIKQDSASLIDFCESGIQEVKTKDWNDNAKSEAYSFMGFSSNCL